ncbi:MAG: hypothetical protein KF696_16270 [Planctomycetes bacterium]|nr:hypothetical protein [Planctomycetota bacterium]MCW8137228.1 hypothetical protein [Planctomycetota bacterium]
MLKNLLLISVALGLLLAADLEQTPPSAAQVLERALKPAAGQTARVGAFTWLEDCGIGIKLAPAARRNELPRLLAGSAPDGQPVATGLWELGPDGVAALKRRLEAKGARFEAATGTSFPVRGMPGEIKGNWSRLDLGNGRAGAMLDFVANGRAFALLFSGEAGGSGALLTARDTLLRDMVILPGAVDGSCAPLIMDGRYACVLPGWRRVGSRFYTDVNGGWVGLRLFEVSDADHDSLDALLRSLEGDLTAANFRPAGGSRPLVAGVTAFLREYFRNDGYVQRVLYAKLGGGYLVALLQAPESVRDQLALQTEQFVSSITTLDLGGGATAWPMPFSTAQNTRIVAWQDGRRVLWGALFDDARRAQVLWRQDSVFWHIKAVRNDEIVAERTGYANSSRALNPLVDAEPRMLELPGEWTGQLQLEFEVGGMRTRATVQIR